MNFALFHFIRPYWLLAFIALALLTRMALKRKLQRGNWTKVCDEELLPYILQQKPGQKGRISLLSINLVASILAIVALAGPTWEREPSPAFRNDYGLVVALDLSVSMNAADIKPSRLIRARYKIADILKKRKDGQTALLVYDGDAFVVTPLTSDNTTIASQLEALSPDIMPSEGDNAVLAVEKATELLKQAGLQNGQVLLVTDSLNADESDKIVEKLGGYQLSVLGVGTAQGAPISMENGEFAKDEAGTTIMTKLPVQELQNLSTLGRGMYQTISDNDSDIDNLLTGLQSAVQTALENAKSENMLLETWEEKGVWLLLLIVPLAALSFRRGLLTFALLCLLPLPKNSYAFEWQDLWQTKDQQAMQAYQNKQYDKAAQLFENPEWQAAAMSQAKQADVDLLKPATTATGFYNQGNVFAKAGQKERKEEAKVEKFQQAVKAYNQALKLDPSNEDAKFNKNLVEKALKELKQQQQQQQEQSTEQKKQQSSQNKQQQNQDSKGKNQQQQNSEAQQNQNQQQNSQQQQENKQSSESKQNSDGKEPQNPQNQSSPQQNKPDAKDGKPEQQQAKKAAQNVQYRKAQQEKEKNQANEQYLNSIPDDPADFLRRKFKYQYGQRQENPDSHF